MKKLMIVDDSNIIRNRIEKFNKKGFRLVAKAQNGIEAIEFFKQYKPDIVTMDITMPEMEGIECIEELMKIDPTVRILVVSALSDKATGIKALKHGARGFVCKPFSEEELTTALQRLIDSPY